MNPLNFVESKQFTKLGLTEAESVIYNSVLKQGNCTVRDISKDTKLNRCYLPDSDLKAHGLDTGMLLDKTNNINFKPVISKWLKQTDSYFESAETYLLSIPRTSLQLRLASLWPILIGLATLKLIKEKENFLDDNINVKVNRRWVYRMLLLSIPASFSNTLLRLWIKKLRNVPIT